MLFISSPTSGSLIFKQKAIPINEVIHFNREDNQFILHFNPPSKGLIQPVKFTSKREHQDCIQIIFSSFSLHSIQTNGMMYDTFDLFVSHLMYHIPHQLTTQSPSIALINSVIVSTKLPKMIDHLKVESIDLSSTSLSISSIEPFKATEYESMTILNYMIEVEI